MITSRGFEISVRIEWKASATGESERTRHAEEALQSFHRDREAESQQENAIDKSSKDLGSMPPIGIAGITCILTGELRVERYELGWNVARGNAP